MMDLEEKIKIKPDDGFIADYIYDFLNGKLQVPVFQRDFVWNTEQKLELLRSIAKGYPIGSVLIWKPNQDTIDIFQNIDKDLTLGGYEVPPKNYDSLYILDGFQRLSTLIGCLLNPNFAEQKGIKRNNSIWHKEFNFVFNLLDKDFEVVRSKDLSKLSTYQIPVYKLVDSKNFYAFQTSLFNNDISDDVETLLQRYQEIGDRYSKYKIPNVKLYGGTIAEAIEVFQKLNSQGSEITTDWLISASLIKKDPNFRLGDEITNLLENELKPYNFDKLKREVVLNCIINSFEDVYFDVISKNSTKKIENLVQREDFIEVAKFTFKSIIKTVEFLFKELMVIDVKLLPYSNQFIFITYFFNKTENPTTEQLQVLKNWFWVTTYSNYFTIYNLSKQRTAFQTFQRFVFCNESPIFIDGNKKFAIEKFPKKISMGSVRGKALALFMLNYSRDFNPVENGNEADFRTAKIFDVYTFKNKDEILMFENSSENTNVFYEKFDSKNISFPNEKYFLGNFNDNPEAFLKERKGKIIEEEMKFVKSLGLDYFEDGFISDEDTKEDWNNS
ncbi:DUF262 domain-containing protein [Flavobacterium branchiophilum]|uniref:GmrSD restriction endonucleases N-terminal domain-containing protein n=1 Tax=Flavobacterium branchiophilum TaxID=55197 RepID=A0A2H3KPY3_9FLAO|nr:DUF262 domain-containing protein [Flavobacterium branchiophilum]PDS26292.1 hypothetical protein B0A77_03000 [Flavobacterium branchiophilum]